MSYQIQLHPLALVEMQESCTWYEERLAGLGVRFLVAVHEQFEIIRVSPSLFSKKKGHYRSTIVKGFPFTIVYEVLEEKKIVFISYVFHSKRNPKLKYRR